MLRIKWLLIIFLLIATTSFAQNTINIGIPVKLFDAVATGVQTGISFALPSRQTQCTWQSSLASSPASITLQLQVSNDNINYSVADTSISTTGESRTVNFSNGFVRARISAISGGSGITVSINCKTSGGSGGLPGGSNSQVQFNNGGNFDGSNGLIFQDIDGFGDYQLSLGQGATSGDASQGGGTLVIGPGLDNGAPTTQLISSNNDSTPIFEAYVTGGTVSSPTKTPDNEIMLDFNIWGHNSSNVAVKSSFIEFKVDGTVSSYIPGKISFNTSGSTGSINALVLDSSHNATFGGSINTGGVSPTVANVGANSCGTTTPTIAGNDNSGFITVGATAGTQCRITFVSTATTARECTSNDETTTTAVRVTYVDTTHTDFIGAFTAGDKVSYICFAR